MNKNIDDEYSSKNPTAQKLTKLQINEFEIRQPIYYNIFVNKMFRILLYTLIYLLLYNPCQKKNLQKNMITR